MKIRTLRNALVLVAVSCVLPIQHASAQSNAEGRHQLAQEKYAVVLVALENSGYRVVEIKTTFLGRHKIIAVDKTRVREIVVSRSTGEVKSDVITSSGANKAVKDTLSNIRGDIAGNSSAGVSAGISASAGGISGEIGAGASGSAGAGNVGVGVGSDGISASVGGLGLGN